MLQQQIKAIVEELMMALIPLKSLSTQKYVLHNATAMQSALSGVYSAVLGVSVLCCHRDYTVLT